MNSDTYERNDQSAAGNPVSDASWLMAAVLIFLPSFFLRGEQAGVARFIWTAVGLAGLVAWVSLLVRVRRVGTASKIWALIVTVTALVLLVRVVMAWL